MSVRLSPDEKAALDKARGSLKAGDYLRTLIPGIRRDRTPLPQQVAPEVPVEPVSVQTPDLTPLTDGPQAQATALTQNHRHRRGNIITTKYVKGTMMTVYGCADPACSFTMEG